MSKLPYPIPINEVQIIMSAQSYNQYSQTYMNSTLSNSSLEAQKGAALIVVLLLLILIMIAGVIAVRQSSNDLKTATSDQINTLLLQSADSGNQKLEAMVNGKSTSQEYQDITSISGALGHFLLSSDNKNHEFIYCYNPRERNYLANKATIRLPDGNFWSGLDKGYCNYNSADSYTSARQTSIAQMSVALTPSSGDAEVFSHVVVGKEIENRSSKKFQFDIRATSALPSYAEPKVNSKSCFDKTSIPQNIATGDYSVISCMRQANTPSQMIYQQADVQNLSSSTQCIPFGRGALSSQCVLSN